MLRPSSTIGRLIVAVFAIQLLTSVGALWVVYSRMQTLLMAEGSAAVVDARGALLDIYRAGGSPALTAALEDRRGSFASLGGFAVLQSAGERTYYNIASMASMPGTKRPKVVRVRTRHAAPENDALAITAPLRDGRRLIVGLPATQRKVRVAFAEAAALTLAVSAALALASALLIGFLINRRTRSIAETARALAAGNFAARVPPSSQRDGFAGISCQINAMAERIDELLQQLDTVSASLAHDLRSPVARLRAAIDTAIARTDEAEARAALALAQADAEALDRMLSASIELSRVESGVLRDHREPCDVAAICADMIELYEPLAESRQVALTGALTPARAMIDRELFSRALANLFENALKYGADAVVCSCWPDRSGIFVSVADNGPGIPEQDRARAVQRFERLDNARTEAGAGLGLAMAAAVARLHGGALSLSDGIDGAGLNITIEIPADPDAGEAAGRRLAARDGPSPA